MCFVFSKDSCIDLGKPQLQETPPTMVVRTPTAAEIPSLEPRNHGKSLTCSTFDQ